MKWWGNPIPTYHKKMFLWPRVHSCHPGTVRCKIHPGFLFYFDKNTLCLPSGSWDKTALSVMYLEALKPQKLSVIFLLMYTTRTCHSPDIVQRWEWCPFKIHHWGNGVLSYMVPGWQLFEPFKNIDKTGSKEVFIFHMGSWTSWRVIKKWFTVIVF